MRLFARTLLGLVLTSSIATTALADDKFYAFPDTPDARAAVAALAGVEDLSIAAASSGDTTIVGITGNGFERGLIVKGLEASKRKPFGYSGTVAITTASAAKVGDALGAAGYTVPVIVLVPLTYKLPDKCIFAKCLPPDWNALMRPPSDGVGSGGGIFALGGEGGTTTEVGNGRKIGGWLGGGSGGSTDVGNGLFAFGGATTVGNGRGTINGIKIPNAAVATGNGDGAGI